MAGIIFSDRKLGAEVRSLTLKKIKAVLEGDDNEFSKAVLLKLASTVLPRIQQHGGENDEAIKVTIELAGEIAHKNDIAPNPERDSEGQA